MKEPFIEVSPDEHHEDTPKYFHKPLPILILMALVIAGGTTNAVIRKIALVPLKDYSFFLSQLSAISYAFIYSAICYIRYRQGKVTKSMFRISVRPFIIIGIMDALGDILGNVGINQLPGYITPILAKTNILFTALFSYCILGKRLTLGQCMGIVIVITGAIVAILPNITNPKEQESKGNVPVWAACVYILSVAPTALSFVIKERVFRYYQHIDLDIFVVSAYANVFQLLFTFLFFPLSAIPHLGKIPLNQLPSQFTNGFRCYAGISSHDADHCVGAPYAANLYIIINVFYNVAMISLLKSAGALVAFITNTVTFPISTLAFALSWPLLPAVSFSYLVIIGLFVELSGVATYRLSGNILEKWFEKLYSWIRDRQPLEKALLDPADLT